MCGRIGGVAGSNVVALLLEDNCEMIFYLFSGILISEFRVYSKHAPILIFNLLSLQHVPSYS